MSNSYMYEVAASIPKAPSLWKSGP